MISPMYARIIIQNWRIVCPFSSNLANNAWSFSFFSLANNSFSIDKSGRKIRQGNFRDGRVIRDNFFTSMVTWPVSANHVISKDPPRARTSLFINYVRSVHIPVHIKRSSILFFFFVQLKSIEESIEKEENFPSPFLIRIDTGVMRAIHHSPRLDKPRREERQTFPPRTGFAVGPR